MNALRIHGPTRLAGKVRVSGSKNTALPVLFAALLFDDEIRYENVPRLWDIETTLQMVESMGASFTWNKETGQVSLFPTVKSKVAPYEWVKRMRAGILALGPLVARYGEAKVSLPGGCAIGARPVNFHLDAMKQMGIQVGVEQGYIIASVPSKIRGAEIVFPQVTVTGTENLLFVACLADGNTVLKNAAQEPEVIALGNFLQLCGAKIDGLGSSTLTIHGGKLHPPKMPYSVPPDRIETGTWIAAAAVTKSEIEIQACNPLELTSVLSAYREMGLKIEEGKDFLKISAPQSLRPISLSTSPYPGFPTDMQAQMLSTACFAQGTSHITETIFENRFMHVAELQRLGAKIEVNGNTATVTGPADLQGAPLMATDLRASASLVVAALAAHGSTKISRIYHLDRGYQRLEEKLRQLGAQIERIAE